MGFPADFVWGSATASYQIEGGAFADGRGPSVWDMFCREPGKVFQGQTGDVTCDHYHRFEEDVDLMANLGLQAYRLSISWSRVLPAGTGAVNLPGLSFYDRLVDALLARNITPWITLFHWDLPYALHTRGGWLNPAIADWFAEYTGLVVDQLSDRVSHWMTQNEIQCFINLGYQSGEHAPGLKLGLTDLLMAGHNALLAHGKAVAVIRSRAKIPPQVGVAPYPPVHIPMHDTDVEAARRRTFAVDGDHCWDASWFLDPMLLGHYPEDGLERFAHRMPPIPDADLATIHQPLDFLGFNHYHCLRYRAVGEDGDEQVAWEPGHPESTMGWPVVPEGIYWTARFLHERYDLPLVVTENGFASTDWVAVDGQVHDPARIDYCTRYLRELRRACDEGIPVKGYFLWSLMDNFEWAMGYSRRFGMVHVDFETQVRTPKDSARWYRDVIGHNGTNL